VLNKTAESAALLAKCILPYAYSKTTAALSCASTNEKFI